MSKIIREGNNPRGLLHQVQTEDGRHYWISTVYVDTPLGNGHETLAVRCRKSGSVSRTAWEKASTWNHGKSLEEAAAWHKKACESLEVMI